MWRFIRLAKKRSDIAFHGLSRVVELNRDLRLGK